MSATSLIKLTVAALAITVPLTAATTASAGNHFRSERHAVRNHGHDDRNIVRNPPHLSCHRYAGCWYGDRQVPHPKVRDHRTN